MAKSDLKRRRARARGEFTQEQAMRLLQEALCRGGAANLGPALAEDVLYRSVQGRVFRGRDAVCDHLECTGAALGEAGVGVRTEAGAEEGVWFVLCYSDGKDESNVRARMSGGKIASVILTERAPRLRMYGDREDALFDALSQVEPDLALAKEMILLGADVNAPSCDDTFDCMAAELILQRQDEENLQDMCSPAARREERLCSAIGFLLANGFDVCRDQGAYGAQCLCNLTYFGNMPSLAAAQMLLDAGAGDARCYPNDPQEEETALSSIATKISFNEMEGHFVWSNGMEALYQMILAKKEGRAYRGIGLFRGAEGKRIEKVLAELFGETLCEAGSAAEFGGKVYFVYAGGALVCEQGCAVWTDAGALPAGPADVSERFASMLGDVIVTIEFIGKEVWHGKTRFIESSTYVRLDSGKTLLLTHAAAENAQSGVRCEILPCRGS